MNNALKLFDYGYNAQLVDDIKQSIFAIIFTSKGEKIYMPEYGANALDYIDKPHYECQQLMVAISEQVAEYEPRVKLSTIDVITGNSLKDGKIAISMSFKIMPLNVYTSLVFSDIGTVTTA
ncbi:GPW/gp25 family protein [Vibrio parahaemolyticus]|nr:GPW/gp25 family protein [Vibrio parahaemolyticus]